MEKKQYPVQRNWRWGLVWLFDLLAFPLIFIFRRKAEPHPVRRILVIRLDQIGDVVCAIPVFSELRRKYPYAKIAALADRHAKAVLEGNPNVDQFFTFERNWFSRDQKFSWKNLWRTVAELRKEKFDLGIDLRGDIRNIILMTLSGVRFRRGYGIGGGRAFLHREAAYDSSMHQAELDIRAIGGRDILKNDLKPNISLTDKESNDAQAYLRASGIRDGEMFVVVHPEAGYPSKTWGHANFIELIQRLTAETPAKAIILGLKDAREVARAFQGNERVVDAVGRLNLREMIAVLSHACIFLGNDSGPSHLAQAVGVPSVILASGTNLYENWGLWREPLRVFYHDVPCAPCYLPDCGVEGHPCMSSIAVEEVLEAVRGFVSVA